MTVDIFEYAKYAPVRPLQRVRIGKDEKAFTFFTAKGDDVPLHYLNEDPVNDFTECKVDDCLLCLAGKKASPYLLLPVFDLSAKQVAVLMVKSERRPGSLLAEIQKALKPTNTSIASPTTVLISKSDKYTFDVSAVAEAEAEPDASILEAVKKFVAKHEAKEVDLKSILATPSDGQLRAIDSISQMLKLKAPR